LTPPEVASSIRSDSTHTNYDGSAAAVTGVEKRGIKIPLEIQEQAVQLV
jgi:hypothetical protein